VRARVRSPIDKQGVDFTPIDKVLVDPAEFDVAVVDRDSAPSPDDRQERAKRRYVRLMNEAR
jgi:hypothetical protein